MLNPFPILLSFSLLAPFILRIVAGVIFLDLGVLAFKGEKERWIVSLTALGIKNPTSSLKVLGILEILGGLMLLAGFYTQIASLVLSCLTFAELYIEYKDPSILKRNIVFYILLLSITFSLLLSGAGAFAVDIPL